jgi:N-acetyl-anhydromuramyl-L-alanine amidase AmpD
MSSITTINHRFTGTLRKRTQTNVIVIHHSDSHDVSAAEIHKWHLDRGWFGIGYNFVVRANGAIETGRPIDTVGSHAGATVNGRSIGICLTGRLDQTAPTPAQINALVWLIKEHIYPKYGKLPLSGHKDHMSTSCPGRMFPMDRVKQLVAEEDKSKLIINGREVIVPIANRNGRILLQVPGENGMVWVQAHGLTQALGGTIVWDGNSKTATMKV